MRPRTCSLKFSMYVHAAVPMMYFPRSFSDVKVNGAIIDLMMAFSTHLINSRCLASLAGLRLNFRNHLEKKSIIL